MSEVPAENPQPENTEVEENHSEEEAQAEQTETVENTEPLFETENEKVKPMPQRIVQPVTDSLGDIQHIRSELYAQVQTIQHQQDSKFHNLESQLNDMERTIQPEIQKLEHAQEESKQQLNRARDKLNSIQTDELIPLRRQYDQLSSNFDRFVRMDIEAKLKPLQEDIKSSKSKVNDLLLSTQTSFSKVDSSLESISAKIEESQNNLKSQQAKINTQFDSYVPKIGALTHKVQLLRDLLQDSPALGSGQTTVSTSLESTKEYITRLTEQVIPQKIQATAVHFDEAHVQLDQYVSQRVEKVKTDLEKIKDKNTQVITSWSKTEETIDNLLQTSDSTKDSLKNLQDNVKIKLQRLSFEVESSLRGLEARAKDMSTENSNASNSLNTKVEDEISSRRKQVDMSCRRVLDQIRKDYSSAERAQNRAIQRINELKDTLEGEGNIVGKMRDIKLKLNNVVNTIELTNEQRMTDKQKGALPINIHNRLAALEARMLAGEERLAKLDGKGAFRNPHKIVPTNEKIDLLPQPAGEGNDLDRALYINNQSMSVAASASISSRPAEEPKSEVSKPEKEEKKPKKEKPEKEENKPKKEKPEKEENNPDEENTEAEVDVSIKMSEAVNSKSKKKQKKEAEENDEEEEEKPKKKKKKVTAAPKVNEDE